MTAPAALDHALNPAALRAARITAGHTLMSAAEGLGRPGSWSVVSRYERGLTDPPTSVLAALARLYGVHPGEFFTPLPQT
jgi:hypothetical protein